MHEQIVIKIGSYSETEAKEEADLCSEIKILIIKGSFGPKSEIEKKLTEEEDLKIIIEFQHRIETNSATG